MKDLYRRGPKKLIFYKTDFLQNSVFPYQSSCDLMARIPAFHAENRGSNPAGGIQSFVFFHEKLIFKVFLLHFRKETQ